MLVFLFNYELTSWKTIRIAVEADWRNLIRMMDASSAMFVAEHMDDLAREKSCVAFGTCLELDN